MPMSFEFSLWPTCKNPRLTHRQDAQCWQRYEHISSSARRRATGHSAPLTRSWVTLILTASCKGRQDQFIWCYWETDVAYCHNEIREPVCKREITHIAMWKCTERIPNTAVIWSVHNSVAYCLMHNITVSGKKSNFDWIEQR